MQASARLKELRKEFLKGLDRLAPGQNRADTFRRFARLASLAVMSQTAKSWGDMERHEEFEGKWRRVMESFGKPETVLNREAGELLAVVVAGLEEAQGDFLGFVMEDIAATNKHVGQFFTPRSVARLMAKVNVMEALPEDRVIGIMDCACGAGVLLIEGVNEILDKGVWPGRVFAEATDIDEGAYSVCYLQLSLLGIPAKVILGDSLSRKFREWYWTPAAIWFGTAERWERQCREERERERKGEAETVAKSA